MGSDPARLSSVPAPVHGALEGLGRKKAWEPLSHPPRWHGWSTRTGEAARAARFITRKLRTPTGHGAGKLVRLAPFQRTILQATYGSLATFASVPAGNGKTTLMACLALERICRGDEYTRVNLLATKRDQARAVQEAAKEMIEWSPELIPLMAYYQDDGVLEYRPTGSRMVAQPARLSSIEGLAGELFLIDEVGFAADGLVYSILARLGKRPDSHVLGMGTPGFIPNIMHALRELDRAGELPAGCRYLEWAAPEDADYSDRQAWRIANPAIAAGFLREDAIELQASVLPESHFATYHLGIWTKAAGGWLPPGAWEACPYAPAPRDGAEVVIAVEGTWKRTLSVVGCGLDGTVFHCWSAEAASDDELRAVLAAALERWDVLEVSYPRRVRTALFEEMKAEGMPCVPWPGTADLEAASAGDLYRSIMEAQVSHDHDAVLSAHMAALQMRRNPDRTIRLTRADDSPDCDAALAARAAWYRAAQLAEVLPVTTPTVY